ncbi:hypothetical protein M0D68_19330 [Paraburkholderia sp. SEWSISQ10-3 4]|uniref:HVO_A0114 family putative DNA-binding protein n=1 Tax=Paraburkholderia TaxID=1822464 RepID=UPI00225299A9|nr:MULTISPECIES: hypothetical protein [Paraburkholderia]MCX4140357.1 hypothetical protein [Paraburkholderia aspalathi]MDN7173044.1 hypothetical protein [Paraburkholderia sp. SEWSISQ10-3 4]MDQ6502683.1 hypothetical protein [Paraburkholderia aspalathi]
MTAALTPKRLELLRHLHREGAESISALAKTLARDYKRVHEDVTDLEVAGLLVREGNWLSAPWDTLVTDVALSQVARQRVLAGISRGWEAGLKMVGFFSTNKPAVEPVRRVNGWATDWENALFGTSL